MEGPRKKPTKVGIISLAVIVVAFVVIVATCATSGDGTPAPTFTASVGFNAAGLTLVNEDTFDWTDVKLDINPGTFSSGYTFHVNRIRAGAEQRVIYSEFAKSGGERFNPITTKVQKFSIIGETPDGTALWLGEW